MQAKQFQAELQEHLGVKMSITHLNRIRAAHGLRKRVAGAGKNHELTSSTEGAWLDGVGGLLLLSAVHETGLLAA